MKLYMGLFVLALGVVLLLAGGNGSAFKLWNVIFGKGLPSTITTPPSALGFPSTNKPGVPFSTTSGGAAPTPGITAGGGLPAGPGIIYGAAYGKPANVAAGTGNLA